MSVVWESSNCDALEKDFMSCRQEIIPLVGVKKGKKKTATGNFLPWKLKKNREKQGKWMYLFIQIFILYGYSGWGLLTTLKILEV